MKDLTIKSRNSSQHGNSKATCWKYIGQLFHKKEAKLVDETRYYCSLYLEAQQLHTNGHIFQVASFGLTTSSGNMNLHLSTGHGIQENDNSKIHKVLEYFKTYQPASGASSSGALTSYELNRDLVLWLCRDLQPFEMVAKESMVDFFKRICQHLHFNLLRTQS